jgi:short-subunit dehydrogenase
MAMDLAEPDLADLEAGCRKHLASVDGVFYIAGYSEPEKDFESLSEEKADRIVAINFSSAVKVITIFVNDLKASANGNCICIGSIAQARPRSRNTIYASSKAALEFFCGGLRHALAQSRCRIQFYRVGYLDTQMTAGQKLMFPKMNPSAAAEVIYRNLGKDVSGKYLPGWWQVIALIYRLLPWGVFKRLSM